MSNFAVRFFALITLSASVLAQSSAAPPLPPHEKLLREIYQELVEINTAEATALPRTPELMKPLESITADTWLGVLVIPTMVTDGTDGRFLSTTSASGPTASAASSPRPKAATRTG